MSAHGTDTSYRHGCRCRECTTAHSDRCNRNRGSLRAIRGDEVLRARVRVYSADELARFAAERGASVSANPRTTLEQIDRGER